MLFFTESQSKTNMRKAAKNHQCSPPDGCVGSEEKRASHTAFGLGGGLSLEASLVLPLFLAGLLALLFFIQVIQLQMRLQKALYGQALKAAGYAYYLDSVTDMDDTVQNVLEAEYIKSAVIKEVGAEYLDSSYIVGGSRGLSLNLTGNMQSDIFDAALRYKVSVPFDLLGIGRITLVSRARCRIWSGGGDGEGGAYEDTVYMTANGEVYHIYEDCTYLVSDVCEAKYGQLDGLRNDSGAKYYACAVCKSEMTDKTASVYYTRYGTRYHTDRLCGNLHSNIFSMPRSEAEQNYRACSKCAKRRERE
ncbi:MAG: hypothetical protein NC223_12060 [Butyrivibrio sp.]|nr:hypothetical protein [Butyrivibrio sp.]